MIVGSRYYTEHGSLTKPTKTSVSYERIYAVDSIPADLKAEASTLTSGLYSGLGEVLAETVIRYLITSNNKKTVRTETKVFDSTDGASVVTFSAYYVEEEDGTVTEAGEPVAVY